MLFERLDHLSIVCKGTWSPEQYSQKGRVSIFDQEWGAEEVESEEDAPLISSLAVFWFFRFRPSRSSSDLRDVNKLIQFKNYSSLYTYEPCLDNPLSFFNVVDNKLRCICQVAKLLRLPPVSAMVRRRPKRSASIVTNASTGFNMAPPNSVCITPAH